jgi:putative transposase
MEGEQKTITVTKTKTGEYYASVNFRQDVFFPKPKSFNKSNTVGIDLGIKDDYIIMSNDMGSIKNPKFFKKHERRIAMLNRKLSRSQSNSNSRKKVLHELNREYEKLAKAREDFQHKVTHQIVSNPNVRAVAVEDLNVKGMTAKNKPKEGENGHYLPNNQCAKRGQNKATLDAGFGRVRQMLDYKCKRSGKAFGKVGRFFASSKTCNNCGHVNKELKVSDQYWTCEKCGEHHERNFNAANNVRDEFIRESKSKKKTKASK